MSVDATISRVAFTTAVVASCVAPAQPTRGDVAPFRQDSVQVSYHSIEPVLSSGRGAIEVILGCNGQSDTGGGKVTLLGIDSWGGETYAGDLPIGQYHFDSVAPGSYKVWSRHIGCWGSQVPVTVKAGLSTRLRVWLQRNTVQTVPVGS